MSTGCQNVSQTDRKIYRAPGRQTERQNDSMADSRAAKEPTLVKENIGVLIFFWSFIKTFFHVFEHRKYSEMGDCGRQPFV